MVSKRKSRSRGKPNAESGNRERDQDTIRQINAALDADPVDKSLLRKLAVVRGLVNNEIRSKVWPLLVGVEADFSEDSYAALKKGDHKDAAVVTCDVQRSLWSFTEGWTDEEREAKRRELQAILTAVVCTPKGEVYYYQGLNDIASVLLFVAGERAAYTMLDCMARCQLRDCTRPSLDAVLELLHLLLPLLKQRDKELWAHIDESGIPPFFALSWFITWFSHNLQELHHISRLFDVLMASHPLMPIYISAVIMQTSRESILQQEDTSELHRALTNLPILGHITVDSLAAEAFRLFKECPPQRLLALSGLQMQSATSAEARLQEDHWVLPVKKAPVAGVIPRDALKWFNARLRPRARGKKTLGNSPGAVAVGGIFLLSSLAAMYISKGW